MRNLAAISAFTLFAMIVNAAAFADHHLTADKDAIIKIEKEWANALLEGDGKWFKDNLAQDYRSVFSNGEVWNRARFANAVSTGVINCSKCDILELDVRIFSGVAVAISEFDVAGKSNGKDYAQKEKWTDVYVKDGDTWKCVSSHGCKLPE